VPADEYDESCAREDFEKQREADEMNEQAFLALRFLTPGISVAPVIKLLRSKHGIDEHVRSALADALDERPRRSGGMRFQVTGQGTGKGAHVGGILASFDRMVEIARYVQDLRSSIPRPLVKDAIRSAAARFNASEKTVDAALTAVREMDAWLARHMPAKPAELAFMSDERWEAFRQRKYRSETAGDPPLDP
jgi:hypothetical protein